MIISLPADHFDPGKPFYPLIMSYLVHLHGLVELDSRWAVQQLARFEARQIEETFRRKDLESVASRLVGGGVTPLMRDLTLRSEYQDSSIAVDVQALCSQVIGKHGDLVRFLLPSAAGSLLIVAYEVTKGFGDKGPLWEFFRHCRNAAAHNGQFRFGRGEPKHLAEWDRFKLQSSMHGTPLFGGKGMTGLLGPGDPIRLLWDIEQAYPNINVEAV
jgi:hypothetical protein